ncbi:Surp module family protein [Coccidioides posadasii C735 delta SOWgp]|uniref:Pre-mRNA splicing factor n=5 Tax=Coccidioides posadasii TaxID=199306 RepID=E9D4S4_COCPS|nr:Surp module family protein [Coccidioides posadasii C735 delta SOWgp]EER24406.1 Surp module family protein [Coccidioides posadasii C735 delta SOWgp]EFW18506.1 pre-mRNA splicing factor [Coccidioides posadasii str. Silveira]KMM66116.1 pre-mRNA splicing factor [Coccidioides posadasii RMSCC 3488]|eukprot:XP_003066551.1 Surp module family protein [Coccidioides posadasii C735 delta SOWgp]
MTLAAVNGPSTPAELPEEVSKPPEGVVVPPKDIRTIIEKTAGFVARNGFVFEDRVREKERNNPKFSFLNPADPYAAFYNWRLNEIKAGRGTAVSAGRAGEPVAVPEEEKPKGPEAPPEFHFSARMPNINALDLEVVKLTALFVAKRGKSFMTALSQRETRNYQFDFLRPQHSLYQFFTRLVDQYAELFQINGADAAKARIADLEKNVKNKYHILDRAKQRAEWVKYQEQQKQKKEEEEEQERIAYAQIDWHDFVVVETVLFTETDDHAELPPPTSLNDLQTASLEQKAMVSLAPANRRIEEAMPTDDETKNYYNAYPTTSHLPPQQPTYAPSPIPTHLAPSVPVPQPPLVSSQTATPVSTPTPPVPIPAVPEPEARAVPTPPPVAGQPPMRIRSDYVPRAQAKRLNTTTVPTSICPNCKQQIPIAEMEQHMRIELLDPRWKEQRAKAEARYATTNLSTADVANNLKRLASQRSDVFDQVITPDNPQPGQLDGSAVDPEEEARRKRMAMSGGVDTSGMPMPMPMTAPAPGSVPAPPGYGAGPQGAPPGIQQRFGGPPPPGQPINIEEQIRQIHQKFKQ